MNPQAECQTIAQLLHEIDSVAGLKNVNGEIIVFTTPPSDPKMLGSGFRFWCRPGCLQSGIMG